MTKRYLYEQGENEFTLLVDPGDILGSVDLGLGILDDHTKNTGGRKGHRKCCLRFGQQLDNWQRRQHVRSG